MAKKRKQNKFGHAFVCEWLGKEWFRDDQGKITSDDGKYAGDAFNKLINEQYPIVAPVELEKVKKKRGRPPKVSVDTAKPKPEPEEEDKPGRTKRILRAMYPDLFETGEKLREIWTGEKTKDSKDKDKKQMASTRGGRLFDVLYPGVRNKASDLKSIFTGDKNKDEEQKTDSEKKRQNTETRLEMERIQDSLNDNGDYLRDLIAVQQRSANLLSQIADNIKNLSGGGGPNIPNIPDLPNKNKGGSWWSKLKNIGGTTASIATSPITATVATGALGAYGAYKAGQGVKEYSDIPNREDKNVLDASSTKPDGTEMTDAEMREQAFNQRGKNMAGRETNTKPVIPETKPAATDIATSKETEAIAEAKQKQVKAENILTFKGDEIRFNADRLTFDVQSLTIENKAQQQQQAPASGQQEGGPSGAAGGPSGTGGASGAAGGAGSGAAPGGEGAAKSEGGAPITGKGKAEPAPTLTEEQKKDLGALAGEGIKADDPRAKQYQNLTEEQLKAAGIEKTPEGGFKQTATETSKMTDEEVAKKAGGNKIEKVLQAGPGFNLVQYEDGRIEKRTGDYNWRNNNPGNMEWDKNLGEKFGAIKAAGSRFAIFPDEESGNKARAWKLFEREGGAINSNQTIAQQIYKWAPPNENDTQKYINAIAKATGVDPTKVKGKDLTQEQRDAYMQAMHQQEGMKKGKVAVQQEGTGAVSTTPEQIAKKREQLEKQELAKKESVLAAALNPKQGSAMAYASQQQPVTAPALTAIQAATQPAVKENRPKMTVEDEMALRGEELPDAMKLPGGDEGLKDRDVRSANLQNASNIAEKQYKEEDAAKLDASQIAGYETSFDVGTGPQGLQPVAAPIPDPPRRPADLTTPPQADNKPAPPSPKAQEAGSKEQRQRSVESHSPMPGGNGAQFLEAVFRIMPYLLHQKKHAPQVGRRWHY